MAYTSIVENIERKCLPKYLEYGDCFPLYVVVNLTTKCNHSCNFCYSDYCVPTGTKLKKNHSDHELPTAYAIKLLDELGEVGVEHLVIGGDGESLLHPGIKEILSKATKNFSTILYTNLDHDSSKLEDIVSLKELESLGINFVGTDLSVSKKVCGRSVNVERIKSNIQSLAKKEVNMEIVLVVRDDSVSSLEETIYWCLAQGKNVHVTVRPAFNLKYEDGLFINEKTLLTIGNLKGSIKSENLYILDPKDKIKKETPIRDEKGGSIL